MTPERLEEIRRHVADYRLDGDCSLLAYDSARVDRRALLAEVDRLRGALTRISEHGERCSLACGQGWEGTCGCGKGAGYIADAALEGAT